MASCAGSNRTLPLEGHGAVKEVRLDEEEEPHREGLTQCQGERENASLHFTDRMRIQKGFELPGACWPVVTPRR